MTAPNVRARELIHDDVSNVILQLLGEMKTDQGCFCQSKLDEDKSNTIRQPSLA